MGREHPDKVVAFHQERSTKLLGESSGVGDPRAVLQSVLWGVHPKVLRGYHHQAPQVDLPQLSRPPE